MLAVARALIGEPKVLMLDEPSAGLSPKLVGIVFDKLVEVRATGVTIVLVEQNVKAALAIADRAAVLVEGRERVVGTARELATIRRSRRSISDSMEATPMLQLIADGFVIGSVIALGAIGVTLVYSILRFANFAHGEYLTWGAYLAWTALLGFAAVCGPMAPLGPFSFGWTLLASLGVAAIATAALALLVDLLLFRQLRRHGSAITLIMASFGAALVLRNLLQFIFGAVPEYYSREIQVAIRLVPRDVLGGLRITPDQLFVLGLTAVSVVGLHLFLTRTTLGKAMRATSINPQLARVTGIDVDRVIRATWIIGAVLAAVAGVFSGLTVQLRPQLGLDLLLPLFAAAILGGIGSVYGAVAGGLIVGLAESLSVPIVGAEYRAATAFIVLIAILLIRPTGLFGERT